MSNGIYIIKRDGSKEPINIDKIHKVVQFACEDLAGVSASQIEMNANLQFYDGMSTSEIQEVLVRSANDLISLETPNYQFAAARLLSYGVNKDVFGEYTAITLKQNIDKNIDRGVYDKEFLELYTAEEIETLDSYIRHKRDENFTYAGLRQVVDKYLCQDRSTGKIFETPQFMYMMIAATLFANYPKDLRMHYVRRYYDATSLFKINIPTPVMAVSELLLDSLQVVFLLTAMTLLTAFFLVIWLLAAIQLNVQGLVSMLGGYVESMRRYAVEKWRTLVSFLS